jgi:hypothetical protein
MKYIDYFLLSAAETTFHVSKSVLDSSVSTYKNLLLKNGISYSTVDKWFNNQMIAFKDAAPIETKFPLIVIAQGNYHSVHHQSFLSEFLASYGYIVVTTPSQTRISGQLTDNSRAITSTDEQIEDMEFAINSIQSLNYIDFNNIALIGHSFGGRSILLFHMKNKYIKCLLSLDEGLGLNTAVNDIKSSSLFNPSEMDIPLLHIYEDSEEFLKPDFSLINLFDKSNRFLIKIREMKHFYFSSLGLVSGAIPGFSPVVDNLKEKYKIICNSSLYFLDSILKGNESGLNKLNKYYTLLSEDNSFIEFEYK